jgi:PucR C-terminal helix-turn-helix domain
MATATAEVQAAVDRLGAALGRAVLVEDVQHHPLWWSAQGEVDGTRMRTILQREPAPAAAAVVVRLGLARAQGPVRVPAVPEAEMLPRWCVPLRAGRDLFGYLWVLDPDQTVTEADLPDIEACADLAALTLAEERITGEKRDRRRAALLARLVDGPDPGAARELIRLEDLDPGATVVVQLPQRPGGWPTAGGMSVHVGAAKGTSGAPVPLAKLHIAVARARVTAQAVRAGAILESPTWDSLGSWHLIAAAPDDVTVAFIHPAAEKLAGQRRPDLMITARALLDHGGDVARAAEALHIHRTTLYYRIERIEALTGVDLKDGPGRDNLHMALRLAAFRRAAG